MKTDLLFTTVIRLVLRNDNKNYFLSSERFEANEIKEIKNVFNITNDIITLDDIIKAYESKKDYFNSLGIYFNTSEDVPDNSTIFITEGNHVIKSNSTGIIEVYCCANVTVYGCGSVFVDNAARVKACGCFSVFAYGSAFVSSHDCNTICIYNNAKAYVYGNSSKVFAHDSAEVFARDNIKVKVYDRAKVG